MPKKQPKLYRTPRKPGYLGGYNWPAMALGCLLLVVVNFIATQYIAARFQYQPAAARRRPPCAHRRLHWHVPRG